MINATPGFFLRRGLRVGTTPITRKCAKAGCKNTFDIIYCRVRKYCDEHSRAVQYNGRRQAKGVGFVTGAL